MPIPLACGERLALDQRDVYGMDEYWQLLTEDKLVLLGRNRAQPIIATAL